MITLSLKNVEELLFYDKAAQAAVPDLAPHFQTWTVGTRAGVPAIARQAAVALVAALTPAHAAALAAHWGRPVAVEGVRAGAAAGGACGLGEVGTHLDRLGGGWNVSLSRAGDRVSYTCWR